MKKYSLIIIHTGKAISPGTLFMGILWLCFSSITSCKKEEATEFTDSPIIESYLEPGNYLTVKISRQIPFAGTVEYSGDDLNNLTVTVEHNNATHTLTPLGDGNYIDSSIIVAEGENYNLFFQFNSKTVTAYTYIPSKPLKMTQSATEIAIARMDSTSGPPTFTTMPDPIEINWTNSDGSYYLILVENIETTLDPIRDFGDDAPPGNIFRKSPTNLAVEEIRPMEFQYYGTHRIILYHVLPDYATLYDDNSTSSQNLTNPSTSIVNGYGIFTGLNSDTLYVEVTE
ncbi:MAG: hypothetical protein FD123_1544 [Bacteroidetes bacterium]|nr:MAG: hypothetical protein FD123_1544 [Bacteroidota bacterium]